jgi:hypothetical protein
MEEVHIDIGKWKLKVVAKAGIQLMKQPIIDKYDIYTDLFEENQEVVCDRKITSKVGVNYYRVEDTDGWLFDQHDGLVMMELVSSVDGKMSSGGSDASSSGWSSDYVRGMAAAIDGIQEIDANPQSHILHFQSREDILINVFYPTRTVGTAMIHPSQGKSQLFRRDCSDVELVEIFKNPHVHTEHGYQQKATPVNSSDGSVGSGFEIGVEEELRNSVLECDVELQKHLERRASLFKSIVVHSVKRRIYGNRMNDRRMKHDVFLEEERRIALTCQFCNKLYESNSALKNHVCDTPGELTCHVCGKTCKSNSSFKRHKDSAGHW